MGFPESDVSLMSICKGMSPAVVKRNQLLTEQKIILFTKKLDKSTYYCVTLDTILHALKLCNLGI